jgi:hypothetical protein
MRLSMLRIKSSKSTFAISSILRFELRVAAAFSTIVVVTSLCLLKMLLKDWRRGKNIRRGNGPDPCNFELHREPGTRGGAGGAVGM